MLVVSASGSDAETSTRSLLAARPPLRWQMTHCERAGRQSVSSKEAAISSQAAGWIGVSEVGPTFTG